MPRVIAERGRSALGTALLVLLTCGAPQAAELRLHPMFQPHAVLQRDAPIRVFGTADARSEVTVEFAGAAAGARADAAGRWEVELPPQPAGGPHALRVRGADGSARSVDDVLVGDVWLCAGQSNMVLQVHRSLDSRAEIAGANNDRIRLLAIGETGSAVPLSEFATPVSWKPATSAHVADFSATCYFFARELQKTVDVPMGLVVAAWGGSRIQAWTSVEALRAGGGYDDELDVLEQYVRDPLAATERWGALWQKWWRAQPNVARGDEPWNAASNAGEWRAAPTPLVAWERWGVPALAAFDGMVWYRTTVTLDAAQAAQPAVLHLGAADEVDIAWVNGRSVGSSYGWDAPREYRLAPGLLRAGENTVAVNVLDTYRDGGLVGPADARRIEFADGTRVALDTAGWRYRPMPADFPWPPRAPWQSAAGLSTLYNGMVAPIGRYGFRGVVWYQGESNTFEAARYGDALKTLIGDWRARFGAGLPWLNVQLANHGPPPTAPGGSGWAALREVQRLHAQHDPRYGYATAIDIGDRYDVHPANKQELGRRLARLARHLVYGETSLPPSGPRPLAAWRDGAAVRVRFGDVTQALVAYGAVGPIGFELCGAAADSCRYAEARIEGDTVRLDAAPHGMPVRVRHAWADNPIVTLFDGAGLPAVPFELPIASAPPQ